MRFFLLCSVMIVGSAGCVGGGGGSGPVPGDAGAVDPDGGRGLGDAGVDGVDAGPGGETDAGAGSDAGPPGEVDHATVFANVLYPRCSGCHGAFPHREPDLSRPEAIVERESAQVPGAVLVVPGDADASYLYRKLAGTHGDVCTSMGLSPAECGLRMPQGMPPVPLSEEELEMVREWIDGGADF